MEPISTAILIKIIIAKIAVLKAGAAVAALVAVTVVLLTFEMITSWFQDHAELKESDVDNLAGTIQEKLETGQYNTVQFIFNKRTHSVPAARSIKSNRIDSRLAAIHASEALAIYT